MIRSLRRLHLTAAVGLALVGPAVVAVALAVRPSRAELLAASLPGQAHPSPTRPIGIDPDFPVDLALAEDGAGRLVLVARARASLRVPDPLLYIATRPATDPAALPEGARLLGSVSSERPLTLVLPADSGGAPTLVLWSNARRRVVASSRLPTRGAVTP